MYLLPDVTVPKSPNYERLCGEKIAKNSKKTNKIKILHLDTFDTSFLLPWRELVFSVSVKQTGFAHPCVACTENQPSALGVNKKCQEKLEVSQHYCANK